MKRLSRVLLFGAFCVSATYAQTEPTADVKVLVLTYLSSPVSHAEVRLTEIGTRADFSGRVTRVGGAYVARQLPYGAYSLRVLAAGLKPAEHVLRVVQPRLSLRVFLRVAAFSDEPPNKLVGNVAGGILSGQDRLWVRALPLLSFETIAETEVNRDGSFEIAGLAEGEYVLAVMKDKKTLAVKLVSVYGTVRVKIDDLGSRP